MKRDRGALVSLALLIAADLLYGLSYPIAEDKDAYYLPTFVALVLLAGRGAAQLAERGALWTGSLVLVPVLAFGANLRHCDHSRDWIASDYASAMLDAIPEGGLLLTLDWQVYSPALYMTEVEGKRLDVVLIDVSLLRRSWYFDYLRRRYPRFIEPARSEVDAFVEELVHWEHDPALYAGDREANERINQRFFAMIEALVGRHLEHAPVFATHEVIVRPNSDPELTQRLTKQYGIVPHGIVFQLHADRAFHEPGPPPPKIRGLFDGTRQLSPDDVAVLKVRPAVEGMNSARDRYLTLATSGRGGMVESPRSQR
jgi:hypothetical protein